jgi:hypothetical protein
MASVVINGDVSGSVTLQAPAAAGSTVVNLPSTLGNTGASAFATTDSSGNLGLGVTPSASWFTGSKVFQFGAIGAMWTNGSNNTAISSNAVFSDASTTYLVTGQSAAYYRLFNGQHNWFTAPSGTAGNAISFTQAMTLDANGNLALGTTSAADSSARATISGISTVLLDASGSLLRFNKSAGTDTGWLSNRSYSWHDGNGLALSTQTADPLRFGTNGSERARIDSSGNLLVGTTSANGKLTVSASANSTPTGSFTQTSGSYNNTVVLAICNTTGSTNYNFFYGYDAGAGTGKFQVFGTGSVQNATGSYGAFSDAKLKENIIDASPKLAKLQQVRVVNYNLKGDDLKQIGVVAQELEQVFPGMVEETPDRDAEGNDLGTTTKSVKYSVFVPMLIKAIQELKADLDATKAELAALKGAQ